MADETNQASEQDEAIGATNASAQYPLANDANGEPLDVSADAVAWRVRKLARKAGRPKLIFDSETGRPMELALTITFDDFCEHVAESGRYRLEAVDSQGRTIPGCVAITEVALDDEGDAVATRQKLDSPQLMQLVAQLVDTNARVMQAMASAFGQVHPVRLAPPIVQQAQPQQPPPDPSANMLATIQYVVEAVNAVSKMNLGSVFAPPPSVTPTTATKVGA
jgi:hypothetical protein